MTLAHRAHQEESFKTLRTNNQVAGEKFKTHWSCLNSVSDDLW